MNKIIIYYRDTIPREKSNGRTRNATRNIWPIGNVITHVSTGQILHKINQL